MSKVDVNARKQNLQTPGSVSRPFSFQLELGSLPTQGVKKIDSFTVKSEAGTIKIPNLKITLSMADSDPWRKLPKNKRLKGKLIINNGSGKDDTTVFKMSGVKIVSVKKKSGGLSEAVLSVGGMRLQ